MKTRSPLLSIFLIVAVDVLGLTVIFPFLPFYAESFGASAFTVGLLFATFPFFQLVSGPLLGSLSDRYGRRPVLLVSQIGTLAGFILLARANALWMIFVSRMIDGATAGNLTVAQAYIADVTEPEKRARAFGIIGIAFGLGFLIGPAISGVLSHYGPVYPAYAAAAFSALSIVLTYFLLPEPPRHVDSATVRKVSFLQWGNYLKHFRDPRVGPLLYQFLFFHFSFALFFSGFALFAAERFHYQGHPFGAREVGYVYAFSGLIGAFVQGGMIGRWVTKYGEVSLVVVGFACAAIGYFLLGLSDGVVLLLVSAGLSAFGHAAIRPGLTALCSQNVAPDEQGTILGLGQSLNSVASITMPLIAGFMVGRHWLTAWAWGASLLSLGGLYLILRVRGRFSGPSAVSA